MKFLCVPCDSPMKLESVGPPERGSLSVVYSCPECGYEIAMLTNSFETQMVQSLGVRIGPSTALGTGPSTALGTGSSTALGTGPAEASAEPTAASPSPSTGLGTSRCPFTAMIPAREGALEAKG